GKAVDYDGVAGAQCVDLAKCYLKEVFGISPGAWGDAHCYYDNFGSIPALKENFTRIANTPDFVPKKGDIAVWKSSLSSGGWGHIAICTGEGDTMHFYSYDQNWTGKHDPCTKIKHSYTAFAGVLRPKDQSRITVLKTLDSEGFKRGDKSLGVYALKCRLIALGYSMKYDQGFGAGTERAVNALLKSWGYKPNGVAGEKFIKKVMKNSS
ncbi:MAG: CHAP domain-containing protein, partial [Ruminococcus sp.]|nr:CHAP domain-containing protein [Ruminococcus sp.]